VTWTLAYSRGLPEGSAYWREHCVTDADGCEVACVVERLQPPDGVKVFQCLNEDCEAWSWCPHERFVSETVTMNGGTAEWDARNAGTREESGIRPAMLSGAGRATSTSAKKIQPAGCPAPLPSGTAPPKKYRKKPWTKRRKAEFLASLPTWLQGRDEELTAWVREVQNSE
jgi:hypothetical protein